MTRTLISNKHSTPDDVAPHYPVTTVVPPRVSATQPIPLLSNQGIITLLLTALLIWQPLLASAASVTPTQASNGRPTLDHAANGVPVVNIQNPDANGLSRNLYDNFNVDSRGLILNNSRTLHPTQLGGYIEGNPNLTRGSAKLILNEVTSTNPSTLNGYLEVGGTTADVIVANPNGITCNGCGFINTQHATLTTGTPLLQADGSLRGFDVTKGHILVDGQGVNASNTDRFDLIARSIRLNAELHANAVNMIAGKQQVEHDTLAVSQTTTDNSAPDFAIDSTELGGIYADRIRLIANEQGVGVKLNAPVAAQAGDLVLTADGKIRFAQASAAHDMQLTSNSDITVEGTAAATNTLHINSPSFTANGQQVSANTLNIQAQHTQVSQHAALYASEQLNIEGATLNNAGSIVSRHNINIGEQNRLATLHNTGAIFGKDALSIKASSLTNQWLADATNDDGTIGSAGDVTLAADTINNLDGALLGAGNNMQLLVKDTLNNDQSTIHAHGQLYIAASLPPSTPSSAQDGDSDDIKASLPDKSNVIINKNGQISTDTDNIDIHAEQLDNTRHVATEKIYDISAYDLMEANWLALQDDDPSNDLINLLHNNATLTKDDWLFIFDPGVYTLELFVAYDGQRQNYVDHWLTIYTNYLNKTHNAGISASVINKIRKQLVGTVELLYTGSSSINWFFNRGGIFRHDPNYRPEYKGNSESYSEYVKGLPNPLGESIWIFARTAQLIKQYSPSTYEHLKNTLTQKLKNNINTLNVWRSTCGENNYASIEGCDNGFVRFYQYSKERYDEAFTQDSEDIPALILSGANLNLQVNNINNAFSTLAATGNIQLNGDTLHNEAITLQRHYQARWGWKKWHNDNKAPSPSWRPKDYTGWASFAVDLPDENGNSQTVSSLIVAGGSINGTLTEDIENRTYLLEGITPELDAPEPPASEQGSDPDHTDPPPTPEQPGDSDDTGSAGDTDASVYIQWDGVDAARAINTINARTLALLDRHNGLFSINTDPNHPYLIETRSLFANLDDVLGSDYLTSRLGLTPDITQRRLGDSYYETTLIRDAVMDATGMRFLDPSFESDKEQFAWLMDNAYAAAEDMQLAVGVSLTAAQINALQQDMVWMEEQEVAGVKVLVPVLYLAPGSADFASQGAVIAANHDINLNVNGLANTGAIVAQQNLVVEAGSHGVVNLDGTLQSGGVLGINSVGDIKNQSGTIQGRDVTLQSQNDIINEAWADTTVQQWANGTYQHTKFGKTGVIEGQNNVLMNANNITVKGGDITGNAVMLQANNNIDIGSQEVTQKFDGKVGRATYRNTQTRQLASNISSTLDLIAVANNNLSVIGSSLSAGNDMALIARQGNLTVDSSANVSDEYYHYRSSKEKTTRVDKTVTQQQSHLNAGGTLTLDAVQGDLLIRASQLSSGSDMQLHAGKKLQLRTQTEVDIHLAETKKKGSFGSKSQKHDSTQTTTQVGVGLNSGGSLTLDSAGDQLYQAASLNSNSDINIQSGGLVTFEAAKDSHSETHTSSSGDLAWVKAKGKGQTDETLRQTQMTYAGTLNLDAANGLSIDVTDINQQSISATIDAMIDKDPSLAWLKTAEARGDIDWQKVKETHDSWKYSTQSMGPATALAVAIIATVATAGVAGAAGGAVASTAAGATGTMAGAATTAAVSGAFVQGTSALINNQGNLGHALNDLDHSDTYKGLAVSGLTAGAMAGIDLGLAKNGVVVENDYINKLTNGFELNTVEGIAGFTTYNAVQAGVSAGISSSVFGTSFNEAFRTNLSQAGTDTLAAVAFNTAGSLSNSQMKNSNTGTGVNFWNEGGAGKVALHAAIGGGIGYLSNHDFAAGAAAAGLNELLSPALSNALGENGQYRNAGSQFAGVAGVILTNGDVNTGANIAKYADTYNRQLHQEEFAEVRRLAKQYAAENPGMTEKQAFNQLLLESMRTKDAAYEQGVETHFDARWFLAKKIAAGETSLNLAPDEYFHSPYVNAEDMFTMDGVYGNAYYQALLSGNADGRVDGSAIGAYQQVFDYVSSNHSSDLLNTGAGILGGALALPAVMATGTGLSTWAANSYLNASIYGRSALSGATTWNSFQSSLAGLGLTSTERAALWYGYKTVGGSVAGKAGQFIILETGTQLTTVGGAVTQYGLTSSGLGFAYGFSDTGLPDLPSDHPLLLPFTAGVAAGTMTRNTYEMVNKK